LREAGQPHGRLPLSSVPEPLRVLFAIRNAGLLALGRHSIGLRSESAVKTDVPLELNAR
jgi:hypothetical protein